VGQVNTRSSSCSSFGHVAERLVTDFLSHSTISITTLPPSSTVLRFTAAACRSSAIDFVVWLAMRAERIALGTPFHRSGGVGSS
jgi:hypothetical protein